MESRTLLTKISASRKQSYLEDAAYLAQVNPDSGFYNVSLKQTKPRLKITRLEFPRHNQECAPWNKVQQSDVQYPLASE